jgi:phosphate/sulfate permease
MFIRFFIRDLVLLALCVLAWRLNLSGFAADNGVVAVLCSAATVILTVLISYEVHEWGHLSGALLTGSTVHAPQRLIHQFLFHFDGKANDRHQFVGMSIGGLVASVLALVALLLLLPLATWTAKIILALVGIGIVATFLREVPEAWRVHRGIIVPTGPVYEPFSALPK